MMMQATRILMEEHRIIERVIASVEIGVDRLEATPPMHAEFFIQAADFIKGFADGCHHRKEEGILFPAMEEAGVLKEGGPIGVMLADHEEGRRLARAMRSAAQELQAGDASAKAQVRRNALGYAALMRQHIAIEDSTLFPMANHVIRAAKQAEIAEAFERVEHDEIGEGVHEEYRRLAEALEQEAKA
jgi:hemerythrin-like domain-containing protein